MLNKINTTHTAKFCYLALASIVLIGCEVNVNTKPPPPLGEYPLVQPRPLNDTGVTFFIEENNVQYPVMVPVMDAERFNILSIFNNFVNIKGERYNLVPLVDEDGNPMFDINNRLRQKPEYILDGNGNRVIEEVAYEQKTKELVDEVTKLPQEYLVYGATPTVYTDQPSQFPGQTNIFGKASLPINYAGQDASFGRDVTVNNSADGKAGFQFSKRAIADGAPVPDIAEEFGCVQDHITGLYWENKVNQQDANKSDYHKLHSSNARHTWYDPNPNTNGGVEGQTKTASLCTTIEEDTFTFTKKVNEEKLCGFSDWRIPNTEELRSIIDYSVKNGNSGNPAADKKFFPFIASILHRWTTQTDGGQPTRAFGFHTYEGRMQAHDKFCTTQNESAYHNGTILVRGVYFTNPG